MLLVQTPAHHFVHFICGSVWFHLKNNVSSQTCLHHSSSIRITADQLHTTQKYCQRGILKTTRYLKERLLQACDSENVVHGSFFSLNFSIIWHQKMDKCSTCTNPIKTDPVVLLLLRLNSGFIFITFCARRLLLHQVVRLDCKMCAFWLQKMNVV